MTRLERATGWFEATCSSFELHGQMGALHSLGRIVSADFATTYLRTTDIRFGGGTQRDRTPVTEPHPSFQDWLPTIRRCVPWSQVGNPDSGSEDRKPYDPVETVITTPVGGAMSRGCNPAVGQLSQDIVATS